MTPVLSPESAPVFDEPFRPLPRTWVIGAVGALALHVAGGALVFGYMRDKSVDLGVPGLVIDVELTAPRRAPNDLPVGPDTEALARASWTKTGDAEKTICESCADRPTMRGERLARGRGAAGGSGPEDHGGASRPINPSVAAEETAIPSVATARESVASRTPSPGTGESALRERVTWQKELAAHFDKYKRYPEDGAARSAEVVVNFVLDDVGHIVTSRVVKSSGDLVFDDAALSMLRRSDPVPPPPPLVASAGLSFTMPVVFHVKTQR